MNKGLRYTRLFALSLLTSVPMSGCILNADAGLDDVLGDSEGTGGQNPGTPGAQLPGQNPGAGLPGGNVNPGGGTNEQGEPVPEPDPQNPCGLGGDIFESNNNLDNPFVLSEAQASAGVFAGVSSIDLDVFSLSLSKSDPRSVSVRYDVANLDDAELTLRIFDDEGEVIAEHDESRDELFEQMVASWTPKVGARYRAAVISDFGTCTPYTLKLDATSCTDEYEDNDMPSQAKALTLGYSLVPLATNLTIHPEDPDFFTLEVPTRDPALVVAKHKGADASTLLDIKIRDPQGELVGDAKRESTDEGTELLTNWVPEKGGEVYQIEVRSLLQEKACKSYDLAIQRCTDSFEDNDRAAAAAKLPAGVHEATISDLDKDYYEIPNEKKGGRCVVTYSATSGEDMSMFLFADGKLDPVSEHHEDRLEEQEVMQVSWGPETQGPLILWINAADKRCTPYTITCTQGLQAEGSEPDTQEDKAEGESPADDDS